MTVRGLVLGGGGITGIAWMTGLLHGLQRAGVDVTDADRVVGTSAGSVVGAQVATGCDLGDLWAHQCSTPSPDLPRSSISRAVAASYAAALLRSRGDVERFGRLLGRASIRAASRGRTPGVPERLAVIADRLPVREWPEHRDLRVTAVDTATGELVVLARDSDVALVEAVTASCAVPAVYPPVPVGGRLLVDGGVRSGTNADLAEGCDVVLVVAPLDRGVGPLRSAAQQLDSLGVPHLVVTPDAAAREAIGRNVLDYAARPASARAGHAQAASVAQDVARLWTWSAPWR